MNEFHFTNKDFRHEQCVDHNPHALPEPGTLSLLGIGLLLYLIGRRFVNHRK